jgi:cytochrome c553
MAISLVGFAQAEGDAAAGKAKAAGCVACHGADGNSMVPSFPKLAGQNTRYLVKQMEDIQCGGLSAEQQKQTKCDPRVVPTMAGQLDAMSEQDLADIAAWFASQPASGGQADPALLARGEAIYRGGIRDKGVPACIACHSPTGKGNGPAGYPALGGQHAEYTAMQLKAFRAAEDGLPNGRSNDGDTRMMRDVAIRLTDGEIEAVASYIAGLH